MIAFTERFLAGIEQTGLVEFADRDMLKGRLVNHIAPMIYRITYGGQLDNPIAESVRRDYGTAFDLAAKGMAAMDPKLASRVTEDELAYLAIYIADGIKSGAQQGPRGGKILVVCPEGVATALLIRDQLENLLEAYYSYDLASVKNIEATDLSQYLLIVTAAKCDLPADKTVRVSLFLTEENKRGILEKLDQEKIRTKVRPREIMAIIRRHCGSHTQQMTDLNIELLNYLNAHRSE
jgi:transcriptional antiterminator